MSFFKLKEAVDGNDVVLAREIGTFNLVSIFLSLPSAIPSKQCQHSLLRPPIH